MATPTATGAASPGEPTTSTTASDAQNAIAAMTTAFSMPSGCPDFNGAYMEVWGANNPPELLPPDTMFRLRLSEAFRPSCWPSEAFHATYSPGVCPTGWTYYSIIPATGNYTTSIYTPTGDGSAANTPYPVVWQSPNEMSALCCPSGFSILRQGVTTLTVTNITDTSIFTFHGDGTLQIEQPLTVTWQNSDVPTLTPQPPAVPNVESWIPSWVPGEMAVVHGRVAFDDSPRTNRLATGVFAAVIAVPIVIFLSILGCCICCFRMRRKREKREIAKEQEESQAFAVARTSTQERTPNHSTDERDGPALETGQGTGTPAAAAEAGSSDAAAVARQTSTDAQRPAAAEEPVAGRSNATHALSDIAKPPYPGLPTHGFDGIDEPPPYAEAAPTYSAPRRSTTETPASPLPTQEHTERETREEHANAPAT
ncbi:hypothetical protein PWT90_08914 [Aphanocladium album]|nr:hypothetical protein PWT90_08914 [Aphanocladium album]